MADPFRSEMETVHARNRELEQRVAELDDENRRMVAGFAPTWSRAPFWVLAPALGTIGIFFAALAFLVAFFSMWQVFGPADRTSNPRSCVTVTRP